MTTHRWGTRGLAALAGIAAGGLTLGVGELVAALVAEPAAAPFLAVGNTFVDLTPEWLKSFAIRTFGENDKQVLLAGMAGVLLVVSAAGGLIELRRRWAGVAVLLALAPWRSWPRSDGRRRRRGGRCRPSPGWSRAWWR